MVRVIFFQVYSSITFDKYIQLYNHNQSKYRTFPSLKKVPLCPFVVSLLSPSVSFPQHQLLESYDFWLDSDFTCPHFSFVRLSPVIKTSCALT